MILFTARQQPCLFWWLTPATSDFETVCFWIETLGTNSGGLSWRSGPPTTVMMNLSSHFWRSLGCEPWGRRWTDPKWKFESRAPGRQILGRGAWPTWTPGQLGEVHFLDTNMQGFTRKKVQYIERRHDSWRCLKTTVLRITLGGGKAWHFWSFGINWWHPWPLQVTAWRFQVKVPASCASTTSISRLPTWPLQASNRSLAGHGIVIGQQYAKNMVGILSGVFDSSGCWWLGLAYWSLVTQYASLSNCLRMLDHVVAKEMTMGCNGNGHPGQHSSPYSCTSNRMNT